MCMTYTPVAICIFLYCSTILDIDTNCHQEVYVRYFVTYWAPIMMYACVYASAYVYDAHSCCYMYVLYWSTILDWLLIQMSPRSLCQILQLVDVYAVHSCCYMYVLCWSTILDWLLIQMSPRSLCQMLRLLTRTTCYMDITWECYSIIDKFS